NSWQFNAGITPGGSGGYMLQRQQAAYLTSGTRPAANDSRIQNAVFRNGSLWATHTVLLSTTPLVAGTPTSVANPHNHAGIQWWEIDPTIVNSASGTLPIQRGRIQDPTADNCNNNSGGSRGGCTPQGQFFAFPQISVNQHDDVLIGYSRFSERTYASAAYSFRAGTDPANTMRDSIVFRPGQSNYNIGGGAPFTVRWGDMSHAQVDPLNDTDFWTTQEYADVNRLTGIGIAGTWSTWWARVSPSTPAPSTTGTLIINEFRLRGPQGPRDEFVELYNPGTSPLVVTTSDGSDGWALAYSNDGTAVTAVTTIPVGTVIPAKGHFLITSNQVSPITATAVYSLANASNTAFRDSGGDTGYAIDNPDNGGFAIFKTSIPANFAIGTRMDSVGFSGIAAGLFREGAGLPPISTTSPTGQASHVRFIGRLGEPHDTGANEADFIYVNPVNELSPTPTQGAAGPENLDSPIIQSNVVDALVAPCIAATLPPNRVRVGSGNGGTLSIRRTLQNNTGAAVTRLRFRVVEITTAPAPDLATAILAVTSSSNSIEASPCGPNVTITGLTLEDTPVPVQPQGGGQNSTLSAGTITLAAPLANGSSIRVNFLTNVVQAGHFTFFVNVEALP
ncbi:MAG TPA: lamin tail domain-containing protein, partial [Pyrinomonadaceae bacterium]|nr:lamin tail domain-containing protein [Pyrinomonadaceae bacterium]